MNLSVINKNAETVLAYQRHAQPLVNNIMPHNLSFEHMYIFANPGSKTWSRAYTKAQKACLVGCFLLLLLLEDAQLT